MSTDHVTILDWEISSLLPDFPIIRSNSMVSPPLACQPVSYICISSTDFLSIDEFMKSVYGRYIPDILPGSLFVSREPVRRGGDEEQE